MGKRQSLQQMALGKLAHAPLPDVMHKNELEMDHQLHDIVAMTS